MQSPLFTRAGIRRIERFGISATDGPSRGKRALATTVVSAHPEDNDPAPAQYGKHLADIPLTLRESGRRNCEFSRHRLALAFPALILSDTPIGQQPLFGNNSGMTKKRAVTGHGNTPRGNRCKPRLSSPRISNGTHKARSRFNTVIVRRGPTKSDGRDGRTGRYRNRKRKSTAAFVFNARLAASFTRRTRHARRPRGFFHPTEAGTAPLRPNRTAGSRSPDRKTVPMPAEQSHKAPCENHR